MILHDVQLGDLHLRAPSTWKFYAFNNMILGGATLRGSLQITLAYANDAPPKAGHDCCQAVMQQFMVEPGSQSTYSERVPQNDAVFGFSVIHNAKHFRQYWYRYKNGRLVLALFQCAADSFADMRSELVEASVIARSMELVS